MAKLNLTTRDLEKHVFRGLADHGNHLLECGACGAPLVNVMVVKLNPHIKMKYAATCCHCGDRSFNEEISGETYVAATDYTTPLTTEPEIDSDGDPVTVFTTRKVKDYATK